jgi:hypothetical protein
MKTGMGCFAAFISVFYLVGFGLLGYGIWSALRSNQAAHWPTTPGVLTKVELNENSDGDGTTYTVQVEYTYAVAGNAYTGSRLAFGYTGSSGREAHEEICARLRAAKSVAVRYDPDDPASSALSFGMHRSIVLVLTFAITWLAFMAGFTLIFWLASRNDSVLLQNLSVQ